MLFRKPHTPQQRQIPLTLVEASSVDRDHSSGYTIFTLIKKFFFSYSFREQTSKPLLFRKWIFKTPGLLQT